MNTAYLTEKLIAERRLAEAEYEALIRDHTPADAARLAEEAVRVRKAVYGNAVYIRGLIEISNYCRSDCYYCGIRRGNHAVQRYRLTPDEILACAEEGYALGFRTFVMQGGEDGYYTDEVLCGLISRIKERYPDLIDRFNIPLDEYPRRCIHQIEDWKKRGHELTQNPLLSHKRTHEYASYIMEAMETGVPTRIGGNVLNNGLITNLPWNACVEVPCLVDRNGVQPTYIGDLPEQCAALNRTNINVQLLTIEAARTLKKDYIYQAVMMDPHAGAELSIDDIVAMCDEMIEAHGDWMPKYE